MTSVLLKANGVGPASLTSLEEHGIRSIEDLASASLEEVMLVPGFGESRAKQAIASAKTIAAESATAESPPEKTNEKPRATTAKPESKEPAKAGKKAKAAAKAEKKKQAKASKKAKAAAKAEKKKQAKASKKAKAKAKKPNKK